MNKLLLFTISILGLTSCMDESGLLSIENLYPGESTLDIVTKTITTQPLNFTQQFEKGTTLGLHITTGNVGELYKENANYNNIRAKACIVKDKFIWCKEKNIRLTSRSATIYAYSPYQSQANFDATRIPVHLSPDATQTNDYMYGTQARGQKVVNSFSPVALLNMNHALSLITFVVNADNVGSGCFMLSAVQLGNKAGGTALLSKGVMNIADGKISGSTETNTATRLVLDTPRALTKRGDTLQLMIIPTLKPIKAGEIEALFTINNRTYKYLIPAETKWEKGNRYLYKLSFNGECLCTKERACISWVN